MAYGHRSYDHTVILIMTYNHKYYDLKVTISMTYGHTFYDHKVSNYFLSNFLTIFFFTDIASVIVFAKYNSHWDENNIYIDNESINSLVSMSTSYVDSLEILFEALELNIRILT